MKVAVILLGSPPGSEVAAKWLKGYLLSLIHI